MKKTMISLLLILTCWLSPAIRAQEKSVPLSREERAAFVDQAARLLNEKYIRPDVALKAGLRLKEKWASGAFDGIEDPEQFAVRVTEELQSVSHDKHMTVFPAGDPSSKAPDPSAPFTRTFNLQQVLQSDNNGFAKVEKLDGNVGYLALTTCLPLSESKASADLAMKLLSASDALVIDLRENEGGSGEIISYLLGYFLGKKTLINSFSFRRSGQTMDFYSADSVDGTPMPDIPLFVLTSRGTFSAGEELAFDIQTQKRGTLVGETTGGGANPGAVFPVTDHLRLFIPLAEAVNPVTHGNWEGVGVVPDVACAADQALETALPLARQAAEDRRKKAALEFREKIAGPAAEIAEVEQMYEENKTEEADRLLEKTLSTAKESGWLKENILRQYGLDLFAAGKARLACAVLKMNARLFPDSARALNAFGDVCEKTGKFEEALESYQSAVARAAASRDIQWYVFMENRDRVQSRLNGKPSIDRGRWIPDLKSGYRSE